MPFCRRHVTSRCFVMIPSSTRTCVCGTTIPPLIARESDCARQPSSPGHAPLSSTSSSTYPSNHPARAISSPRPSHVCRRALRPASSVANLQQGTQHQVCVCVSAKSHQVVSSSLYHLGSEEPSKVKDRGSRTSDIRPISTCLLRFAVPP